MMDAGEDFVLIDVREQNEYEIVTIPGATLIPKDGSCPARRWRGCRRTSRWCCTASPGCRSAEALAVLHKAGFRDAVHVGGGVLAWVKQVDPSLPTY